MVKFTKENLDWDIILENISEKQLSVFTDEETKYQEYTFCVLSTNLRDDITRWATILYHCLVLDPKTIGKASMKLANEYQVNHRKIRYALVHELINKLEDYNNYLVDMYQAKDYLVLNNEENILILNQEINKLTLSESINKENDLDNILNDLCVKDIHNRYNLRNILTLDKIDRLNNLICC